VSLKPGMIFVEVGDAFEKGVFMTKYSEIAFGV
jgi:hypothetical protein